MKWHSLRGAFSECPEPPYLLQAGNEEAVVKRLHGYGLKPVEISLLRCSSEREVVELLAGAIGFPCGVKNWDAFGDLLHEFYVEPGKGVVVHVLDAGLVAGRDIRRFARMLLRFSWISEEIERGGGGTSQLEFVYWGAWDCVAGDSPERI